MTDDKETIAADNPIERACGVLLGTMGIMGCIVPFCKPALREALKISITGIGAIYSIMTIISKTNKV